MSPTQNYYRNNSGLMTRRASFLHSTKGGIIPENMGVQFGCLADCSLLSQERNAQVCAGLKDGKIDHKPPCQAQEILHYSHPFLWFCWSLCSDKEGYCLLSAFIVLGLV